MTNVDSETVCLRLLIKGLIVPIRLCILSILIFFLLLSCRLQNVRNEFRLLPGAISFNRKIETLFIVLSL